MEHGWARISVFQDFRIGALHRIRDIRAHKSVAGGAGIRVHPCSMGKRVRPNTVLWGWQPPLT